MLPFLKNRDDAAMSGAAESKDREHDEDFDVLGAVAGDILAAVEKRDAKLLRAALESFCEHIQDLDSAQDQSMETPA